MTDNFLSSLTSLNFFKVFAAEINQAKKKNNALNVSTLSGSAKSIAINLLSRTENQILVLLPSRQLVNEVNVELIILGLDEKTVIIDSIEVDTIQEKLTTIKNKKASIIIATYELLKVKLPSKNDIEKNTTKLEAGTDITYDELIEYFNSLNYNNEKAVVDPGSFAVRGSIIDFWSYSEEHPSRLEYDGDFLESIRYFDPESQRSSGQIESVTLASSIEFENTSYSDNIFDYLESPIVFANSIELEKLNETEKVEQVFLSDDLDEELKTELLEDNIQAKEKERSKISINENLVLDNLFEQKAFWIIENPFGEIKNNLLPEIKSAPVINSNFTLLFKYLQDFADKDYEIFITAENEIQGRRLFDLLSGFNDELNRLLELGSVKIKVLAIKDGFLLPDEKILVFTDYETFNKPYRTKISSKQKIKRSRVKEFASLKIGDFIVHENFGIGKYVGLETIKIGMVEQETIKILYAEGGIVYLNMNYLSLIKKYSSGDKAPPRLTTLGSNEWRSAKKKVKSKIKEAARDLIKLYAQRKSAVGFAFSSDTVWQKELEASFLYEPTPDQAKVTDEVKSDMEFENPMDRLVCGDVGFGKTEVAIRAAFKAVSDGKQVGMLVPTTILAEQHFNTFKDRLSQFPVKVAVLSRFAGKAKQTEIIKELAAGNVDIVIGTHRLLSKDIKFKDLGLLVIDEEHRFGVMAKEKLRQIRVNVDTLTLTATPIPRTLNL
ncbi:MAG: DEAD/DEAH box helicase, partial [Ignavibacteriae bacterium]|nr:DEAD/DEAH box helicase [Ignavibacteriota bacterium]